MAAADAWTSYSSALAASLKVSRLRRVSSLIESLLLPSKTTSM
jgi:hypothetical protein